MQRYGMPVPFALWAMLAAEELAGKTRAPVIVGGVVEEDALADALWGYNGRSRHHTPGLPDPKDMTVNRSWRYSPYVSNDPKRGVTLKIVGTIPDDTQPGGRRRIERVDPRPGALIVYRELAAAGLA